MRRCDQGYRYKPRKGDALLFWSVTPDGKFDDRSLHGACPVVSGTKWVATKWMRDKPLRSAY
jgi:prolyl 4-hydroxylase